MSPKEFVDTIFLEKAKSDSNSKDLARALEVLAKTVFGDVNRFIFELLQNADDSPLPGGKNIDVTFRLTSNYLIFSHNGKQFSSDDVAGISSVASKQSEKDKDQEKTGYKGIGFKSVFGTSDIVQIISGGYSFRFDKNYSKWSDSEYPWQVIPIWSESFPEETKGKFIADQVNTLIGIKNRDNIKREIDAVFSDCQIILFLRHVNSVSFYDQDKTVFRVEKRKASDDTIELVRNGSTLSTWIIKDCNLDIPSALSAQLKRLPDVECPEKLKNAAKTKLTFAASVEKGKLKQVKGSYLYCYLPTKVNRGFSFLINGDFLTNAERTDFLTNVWNEFLLVQIAQKQLEWFRELQTTEFKFQVLKLFRGKFTSLNQTVLEKAYNDSLDKAVNMTAFLPNAHNTNLICAVDGVVDTFQLCSYFPPDTVMNYFNSTKRILHNELESQSTITEYSKPLTFEPICKLFTELNTPNKEPDFSTKVIYFLHDRTLDGKNPTWLPKLKDLAFIPDEIYTLRTPRDLFFPVTINSIELQDFGTINFIHTKVLENCIQHESVVKWLQSVGIKDPTNVEIVRKTVIPMIAANGITLENAIPIARFIFSVFQSGVLTDLDYDAIKQLKLLSTTGLKLPSECYLPDEYGQDIQLSEILNGANFVTPDYVEDKDTYALWRVFFKKIGVRDNLSITMHPERLERTALIKSLPYTQTYFDWLDTTDAYDEIYKKYRNSLQHGIINFTEVDFREHLKIHRFSKLFWKQVLNNWDSFLAQCSQSIYYYYGGNTHVKSFIEFYISSESAIPCTDGKCYKSGSIFSPNLKTVVNGFYPVADFEAYMTKDHLDFFGFKRNISIGECLLIMDKMQSMTPSSELNRKISALYEELVKLSPEIGNAESDMVCTWRKEGKLLAENNTFQPAKNLFCFSIMGMRSPVNSDQFLKIPTGISLDEAGELCKALQIPFITHDELIFVPQDPTADESLKTVLLGIAKYIAVIIAQAASEDYQVTLGRLLHKLNETDFITAKSLSLVYYHEKEAIYNNEIDAWVGQNSFFYAGDWNSPLQRHMISSQLCGLLNLKDFERTLDLMLQLEDTQIFRWLENQGYDLKNLDVVTSLYIDQEVEITVDYESEVGDGLSLNIETFKPAIKAEDIDFTNVQPTIKTILSAVKDNDQDYNEISSTQVKVDIGKWSEIFVHEYFKKNADIFTDIKWVNELVESGLPYDFMVNEQGTKKYIEVKGTTSKEKELIYLSQPEWRLMFEQGANYSIYRIYGAGSENYRFERIDNPKDLAERGIILSTPIRLHL